VAAELDYLSATIRDDSKADWERFEAARHALPLCDQGFAHLAPSGSALAECMEEKKPVRMAVSDDAMFSLRHARAGHSCIRVMSRSWTILCGAP
jgi:hypothetical protein